MSAPPQPIPRPLTAEVLLHAYTIGLFPMARSRHDPRLYWVDPQQRGIIPLDAFHVSRSLMKVLKKEPFDIRCDTAFADVMQGCAQRASTWINGDIMGLYENLFHRGHAHSVEAWRGGHLVGGLYGVAIGAAFFGESMFSRETDSSKVALCHLVARLRGAHYRLLDTQFLTPHLAHFGAVEISRSAYRHRLAEALAYQARPFCAAVPVPVSELLWHSSSQRS